MTPLLELRGLTVQYRRSRRSALTAVRGIDLSVGQGETVALVGESGSGKSSLGNAVLGLVPAAAGEIFFDGEDITHATAGRRRALTADIQAIFQDPYGSLNPRRTVGQTLSERKGGEDVTEALRRVGLPVESAQRYPAQFSGGQRQRIAVARALVVRPRLIVCDEPTSALDLSVQAQVLNLLKQQQRDLGLSYLFITHDLAVVRHIAHRVAVMYRGEIVESGPVEQVCETPRHPYTRALLAAAPVPDPVAQRRKREKTGEPQPGVPALLARKHAS
ncbi:ATP-binding cassette domain-containing protein [Amycolatopsis sp.]|uniref:ATP-binding cassette domain-containing protein n=1 Tax=Amycolatopsis sp. TaxID=37632 RepID=UPI002B9040BC|nr:ATP-binding cassette domain-containing protein [Amycolatopsis sp.]HVV12144.1 ATP-binding cassette domain-containing protein [Amycolatopsis sp.]